IAATSVAGGGVRRIRGWTRRRRRGPRATLDFLEVEFGVVLEPLELTFELLVAVLQLLDRAGELPNLPLKALEARHQFGAGGLRELWRGGALRLRCRRRKPLAAAENAVEQPERRSLA